jgi:glycosyltransferase involved in cell wall biosynthesis
VKRTHSVSVIISSYNQPNCLRLALEGFASQTSLDFEVIVADDGSEPDTFELIERFSKRDCFPLRVVTQSDEGFRKARILNMAIRVAEGEQVIFSDGDCVPFPNYVRRHRDAYRPMSYAVGGYIRLDLERSRALTTEAVSQGLHQQFLSVPVRAQLFNVHLHNLLYRLLRKPRKPKILGGNFSVSRDAIEAVNGFDERFIGFGGEDSDMRNRLNNLGAAGISLWSRAFTCHLDHGMDPRRCASDVVREKRDVSFLIANRKIVRTPNGLDAR